MIDQIESNDSLSVTSKSAGFLSETGGWGKFLAILGFVGMGFMVLAGLFMGTIFSTMGQSEAMPFGAAFGLVYVLIAAVYFFPLYYLFKFSTAVKQAIQRKDTALLETAFENLKSHYKFIGILAAIFLALYALFFIGAVVFGAFASF
jgi:Family of unknown function (DUF5362)